MNQDQPRTADVMALGSFSEITLLQNEHNNLHPQFLANNEYSANVPREERVILSDYLLDLIKRSREGYSYDVYGEDGNKIRKTKRRQTMNFEVHRQLTAQEAHEIRKSGTQRVFPEKISATTSLRLEGVREEEDSFQATEAEPNMEELNSVHDVINKDTHSRGVKNVVRK